MFSDCGVFRERRAAGIHLEVWARLPARGWCRNSLLWAFIVEQITRHKLGNSRNNFFLFLRTCAHLFFFRIMAEIKSHFYVSSSFALSWKTVALVPYHELWAVTAISLCSASELVHRTWTLTTFSPSQSQWSKVKREWMPQCKMLCAGLPRQCVEKQIFFKGDHVTCTYWER